MRMRTPAAIVTTDMQGRALQYDPAQPNGWQRWRAEAEELAGRAFTDDGTSGVFTLDSAFDAYLRGRTPAAFVETRQDASEA